MHYIFFISLLWLCLFCNSLTAQTEKQSQPINQETIQDHQNALSAADVKQKISNIDEHIRSIESKVAHIRSREETHKQALQDNYYEKMEKIKNSLLEKRAVLLNELEPKSE
jgi:uncharacterized protein YlxW (UPF0749 family)